jgi:hypothetical protein
MADYPELEIALQRRGANRYAIELRFSQPASDAEVRPVRADPVDVTFDWERLGQLIYDRAAYGRLLGDSLFAEESVRAALSSARAAAAVQEMPLRVRIFIGASAPELHELHWETLRDPAGDGALAADENLLFSRYLSSRDWRPVRLRPQTRLRALVVIANPENLADYAPGGRSLAPVDVSGELARARASLSGASLTDLAIRGQATPEKLIEQLRHGYELLYLVCHGALIRGEPWLWLEDENGRVNRTSGRELADAFSRLRERPRLVVLASCQSAGAGSEASTNDEGALAALGPRLAEVGVPAVLAMQGNVTMRTVERFMPVFFRELARDGQIDRAVAAARGAVRGEPDWWAPALYMRLKSGRLWYTPGFGGKGGGFEKWQALLGNMRAGRVTPILGPGLTESLFGSRKEMAQRWAENYDFPMAAHDREDLPQVAQFLAVNQDQMFVRDELAGYLFDELLSRLELELSDPDHAAHHDALSEAISRRDLDRLITAAGALRQAENKAEPHRVLATLPMPVFITTDPSSLLRETLVAAGKRPRAELCRWNEDLDLLPSVYDDDPGFRPSDMEPLLFHLYGRIQEPDSLVLTEDDYFDYLIGVTGKKDLIPPIVRRRLADTALLFLGFRMDEWEFRVLFRSIMSQEGRRRRKKYAHVAVQIDPEEGRIQEPERARRYLESYFQDADISIYWGSAEDFAAELHERLNDDAN